jgi:hypothetical protein
VRPLAKSLVLGFDCVPSFSSGEFVGKRARVQARSSEREPKGNLDGFPARLHALPQTKAKLAVRTIRFAKKEVASFSN